jgi:putative redox-active protein with C_GCAxxG_C_C motif
LETSRYVIEKITENFVDGDHNCAVSTLKILSEKFNMQLSQQVLDAGVGMNGGGRFRAQCGLVEGALMFLGILGKIKGLCNDEIVKICYSYSEGFENEFGSLSCRDLRSEGFNPENPPHLCKELAFKAVQYGVEFIEKLENKKQ